MSEDEPEGFVSQDPVGRCIRAVTDIGKKMGATGNWESIGTLNRAKWVDKLGRSLELSPAAMGSECADKAFDVLKEAYEFELQHEMEKFEIREPLGEGEEAGRTAGRRMAPTIEGERLTSVERAVIFGEEQSVEGELRHRIIRLIGEIGRRKPRTRFTDSVEFLLSVAPREISKTNRSVAVGMAVEKLSGPSGLPLSSVFKMPLVPRVASEGEPDFTRREEEVEYSIGGVPESVLKEADESVDRNFPRRVDEAQDRYAARLVGIKAEVRSAIEGVVSAMPNRQLRGPARKALRFGTIGSRVMDELVALVVDQKGMIDKKVKILSKLDRLIEVAMLTPTLLEERYVSKAKARRGSSIEGIEEILQTPTTEREEKWEDRIRSLSRSAVDITKYLASVGVEGETAAKVGEMKQKRRDWLTDILQLTVKATEEAAKKAKKARKAKKVAKKAKKVKKVKRVVGEEVEEGVGGAQLTVFSMRDKAVNLVTSDIRVADLLDMYDEVGEANLTRASDMVIDEIDVKLGGQLVFSDDVQSGEDLVWLMTPEEERVKIFKVSRKRVTKGYDPRKLEGLGLLGRGLIQKMAVLVDRLQERRTEERTGLDEMAGTVGVHLETLIRESLRMKTEREGTW